MPTYELHCKECGHEFDKFLMRLIREPDRVCPECGSTHVESGVGGGFATRPVSTSAGCVPRGGFG